MSLDLTTFYFQLQKLTLTINLLLDSYYPVHAMPKMKGKTSQKLKELKGMGLLLVES